MTKIIVDGSEITVTKIDEKDYISLTDIARYYNSESPSDVVKSWMRNKDSFEFYSLWEELHNPNFNSVQMHRIKNEEVGLNRFTMSPSRWKKEFNAIGIVPGAGKYSEGTFAHRDIAFEFASWIDARFKLYIITEFERLKAQEQKQLECKKRLVLPDDLAGCGIQREAELIIQLQRIVSGIGHIVLSHFFALLFL